MGMSSYDELEDRVLTMVDAGNWEDAYEMVLEGDSNGNADSTALLAQFYQYGLGVPKDMQRAIELYGKAIGFGQSKAATLLGDLYLKGDEMLPANISKAVTYYQKGADLGDSEAMGYLGNCYIYGEGVPENPDLAFEWTQRAAKSGSVLGIYNLAVCFDDGIGTPKDPFQAVYWYKNSLNITPDDDFIMYRLGCCLADPYEVYGIIPTQDMLKEAYDWICKAVEKGNVKAHIIIAWFYEFGKVVRQDFDTAHKYMKIAADNGDEFAEELLGRYRKNIYGNYYIPQ